MSIDTETANPSANQSAVTPDSPTNADVPEIHLGYLDSLREPAAVEIVMVQRMAWRILPPHLFALVSRLLRWSARQSFSHREASHALGHEVTPNIPLPAKTIVLYLSSTRSNL